MAPLLSTLGVGVLFLILAAICTTPALSSSYYNNEFFPYTSNKEVGETWKNDVDVQHFIKESFSCEYLYSSKLPDDNKFVKSDVRMIFSKDWLNTETIRKPPTIVITRESLSNTFLIDIRYADFSVVLDIPDGYPESKCYIIPPYKPLSYITFHPYNANISVYALRDDGNDYDKNNNSSETCSFNLSMLSECQIVGSPLTYDKPTHPFFLTASRKKRNDISAFTILTMERLERLVYLAESWGGPISAAVSIVNATKEIPTLVNAWMNTPALRWNVDIHLMFDDKFPIIEEKMTLFPINYLRNIAAKNARTDYVIFIEGDYVVPDNFKEILTKYKSRLKTGSKDMLIAFAFDGGDGLDPMKIPETKTELIKYVSKNNTPTISPKTSWGYRFLNGDTWMRSNKVYKLKLSKQAFVEPYYLANRNIQLYDETMITWGYDKVTQVYDMREVGYKLKVMPDAYMIHLSHNDIKGYKGWIGNWGTNMPRESMKTGTADIRRAVFPGLFTNTYYPEWLWDPCFSDKETKRNENILKKIQSVQSSIRFYRTMLYVLMVCFAVFLLVVLHKRDI